MADGASRSWFIIPAAVVLLVVVGVWLARQGAPASRDHAGKDDVRVVLEAPDGGGEAAAKAVIERLVLLGVDGRVAQVDDRRLELRLRRVAEAEELLASVLDPEPLRFFPIHEEDPEKPAWVLGEGRAATRAKADPAALAAGERFLTECIPPRPKSQPAPCALWRAGPPVDLLAADVLDVSLGAHRRTEEPILTLTFQPEAASKLEALIAAAGGGRVAVVAFGEVAARPELVGESAPDAGQNRWSFSARTGDTDRRTAVERAQRIAVAAKLQPLPRLVVREVASAAPAGPAAE